MPFSKKKKIRFELNITKYSDSLILMMGIWQFIIWTSIPFVSMFFLQKSKKVVSNVIGSVKIRDCKCKIISIHKGYMQPLLPFNFHTQSEGSLGPCWLRLKKTERKRKRELERMFCLHLSRGLPNSTLAAVKWCIYRWSKKLAGSDHLEF